MPAATRREAREHALSIAYERDVRALSAEALLADLPVPPDDYAIRLVRGVDEHRAAIDELIERFSEHWALDRMPVIDRTLLRLATFELVYEPDIPVAVVINEAVDLAKQYSTKDSGRFVNGLLSRLAAEVRAEPVRSGEDGSAP